MAATTHASHRRAAAPQSVNRLAFAATLQCLTGCAIGEVLGMVIGTALGWSDLQTVALAVALAFVFGYSLTLIPLLRSGVLLASALPIAFAADAVSIAVMEVVDNAFKSQPSGGFSGRIPRSTSAWSARSASSSFTMRSMSWPVS